MRQIIKEKGSTAEELNIAKVLDLFRRRWYYIVISLVLALVLSKLYLRYTRPVFQASATVRVQEDENLQAFSIMKEFGFGTWSDNIQSEIQLLRSRTLISEALKELNITCQYYLVGTIVTAELHRDETPFVVLYDTNSAVPYGQHYSVRYDGNNKFQLRVVGDDARSGKPYYFGEKITDHGFSFQVVKRETNRKLVEGYEYQFQPVNLNMMTARAMEGLFVEQSGYMVPILKVSMTDRVPQFATEIVNTLLDVYKRNDILRKTQAATQALTFIREQVDTIKQSVTQSEGILTKFKEDREFINVETELGLNVQKLQDLEVSREEMIVRLIDLAAVEFDLAQGDTTVTVPLSLTSESDILFSSLVSSYNTIIQERLTALQSYTSSHPKVMEYNEKLRDLRAAMQDKIKSIKGVLKQNLDYFEREIGRTKDGLKDLPATEALLQSLNREYEVKEKILETLLEKQAEAQIARASIVSNVQIMDRARIPAYPISPNNKKVYIIGAGLGVSLGLLVILLLGMLKSTLSYREEIESISFTPIIGVVNRSNESLRNKYPRLQIMDNPKSSLSESIRSIRTNLQFIASDKQKKIVAVTSTISGEGKSFITINLGGMISLLGLKVVILDLDLRKPKLHYTFGHDNSVGLSTYLVGQSKLEDILVKTQYENLSIITSGPIPPNPAELVQSQRMEALLDQLVKEYDYVLVDTPPIGLVTDGTTILKKADISLYVVRADYSKRAFARNVDQLSEENNIHNLYIIFNSANAVNRGYGTYGYKVYGYGYYSEEKSTSSKWQFWKKWTS
jgi:capsular exopolysaccharide synthesis family protein